MNLIGRFFSAVLAPFRIVLGWIAKLIPGLTRLPSASIPTRYALLTFVILLIISVMINLSFVLLKDEDLIWGLSKWNWIEFVVVIALLFIIPYCVYLSIKSFMEGGVSEFDEIDRAWKHGLQALLENGIDLNFTPFFLVLGPCSSESANRLHAASLIPMTVKQIPPGKQPLQWFANEEGVFLHLTDACCLSKLVGGVPQERSIAAPLGPANPRVGMATIRADDDGNWGAVPASRPETENVIEAQQIHSSLSAAAAGRTIMPGEITGPGGTNFVAALQPKRSRPTVSSRDLEVFQRRIGYVCDLVRKHRAPICAINGCLVAVPFAIIELCHDQAQLALQRDLQTIVRSTNLRFPVTVLMTDMDNEHGFLELVRRYGMDASKSQRFGKGYGNGDTDVWTPATEQRIRALSHLTRHAFESNIYHLFSRKESLQKPGNGKLYSLLSKIRGPFGQQLESFLVNGLCKVNVMVTGCYFAATGDREDRQAFVSSVISDRVIGNQAKLAWDENAERENGRLLVLSNLFVLISLLSIIALVAMIAWPFFDGLVKD